SSIGSFLSEALSTASETQKTSRHFMTSTCSNYTAASYSTATVTVRVVLMPPIDIVIGTSPGETLLGMVASIWKTPVGRNGAAPAYWVVAVWSPNLTVTGACVVEYGVEITSAPSGNAGVVTPSPVPNNVT